MAAMTEASTTQSKLVFNPTKRQFKWNGDLTSLKDFWITNLEGGNINSLLTVSSNGSTEVLKFESVTINFYVSTKTLQIQGASKDHYVKKLKDIIENGITHKEQDQHTLKELTVNAENVEDTSEIGVMSDLKSLHDDRYEEFELFMKTQRDFNQKIESQISTNCIEISECTIELKDLEQRTKNGIKEVKLSCEESIQAVKLEIGTEVQKLAKQMANLSSKLSSEFKALRTKTSSTEESIKLILQQLDEIKSQVCMTEQSLLAQMQDNVSSSPIVNNPQNPPLTAQEDAATTNERYTFSVVTSNRYESLVEENHTITESSPTGTQEIISQPGNQPTTMSSSTPSEMQPPILQSNNQPTSNINQNQDQQRISVSKGPVLLLGDSILRGIQQRKFAPNRYVNKQTVAGGTKEMKQYINNMEEKNDYDYIIIHTGTNDVGNLSTDEIVKNMENCLGKIKNRWPDARIGLSGLTYVPREEAKNMLIDEINCFYESICSKLDLIYIDNKRVTCDVYGNLNDQVFYDDVHLNNRIGTRKLVTNIKHHLGLRGRNFESRPTSLDVRRNRREIRVQAGPQTFNHGASNRISQPLQALNLLAEYLRESELRLTR